MRNFREVEQLMQKQKMKLPNAKIWIQIPQAREVLREAMTYFLHKEGRKLVWIPEYDEVVDWLTDNKGRGLFLYGECGRGKSLLCRYVLPAILLRMYNKVVTVFDMQEVNRDIDKALSKRLLTLDDVGTEEVSIKYGERRHAFAEIMDAAEKESKLVLISSNLGSGDLYRQYGERTLDRLKATTKRIPFEGKSFRA